MEQNTIDHVRRFWGELLLHNINEVTSRFMYMIANDKHQDMSLYDLQLWHDGVNRGDETDPPLPDCASIYMSKCGSVDIFHDEIRFNISYTTITVVIDVHEFVKDPEAILFQMSTIYNLGALSTEFVLGLCSVAELLDERYNRITYED